MKDNHRQSTKYRRRAAWLRRGLMLFPLVFFSVVHRAAEVHFLPDAVVTDAEGGANSVFAVDIDGDGDLDLATAAHLDNTISWQENLAGDGSSWAPHLIDPFSLGAWAVYAADIDGDGDQDVLSTAFYANTMSWHENLAGDGTSWVKHVVRAIDQRPTAVHAGDVDGDGDMDILSSAITFDTVAWHENLNGDGTAWLTRVLEAGRDDPRSIATGDVDRDGDLDIAVAFSKGNTVAWYQNADGLGSYFTEFVLTSNILFANSVHIDDLDGDGDKDIVASAANDDIILWFENIAVPFLFPGHLVSGEYGAPASVWTADVDDDGDTDILSASSNDDSIVFHENVTGDGLLWVPRPITGSANEARSVGAGDLDGDGDVDVYSASLGDSRIRWYENGTIHHRAAFPGRDVIGSVPDAPTSVIGQDMDGNGTLDVIVVSEQDDSILQHLNLTGDGLSWSSTTIATALSPSSAFAVDVDGNGTIDVLSTSAGEDTISWHAEAGGMWSTLPIASGFVGAWSVIGADVDGDGDTDAVAASDADVAWYENVLGDGGTWNAHLIPTSYQQPRAVLAADVDRDNDLDLFAAFAADDIIAWYENLGGDGSSWDEHVISVLSLDVQSLFTVDMDRDGDMDLLSASPGKHAVSWHENLTGTGTVWVERIIAANLDGVRAVAAADLDGDGDLDAVAASPGDDSVAWHENAGDNLTFTEHRIAADALGARSVFPSDVNGDGKLDLLTASPGDATLAWYANRGGQFRLVTADTGPQAPFEGGFEALLKVRVENNGRPGDSDLQMGGLALVLDDGAGNPLDSAQANSLIQSLAIYLDDGSGTFEVGVDTLLGSVAPLGLASGQQEIAIVDAAPGTRVLPGAPKDVFVVAQFAIGAAAQVPNTLRITHVPASGSSAVDPFRSIPLALESSAEAASVTVTIGVDGDADGVSSLVDCDDADPDRYPGAPEVNDGADNQCPGDAGFGAVDEVSGPSGFHDPADSTVLSWPAQAGATAYQVFRSSSADFSVGCLITTLVEPEWQDAEEPPVAGVFFYLVRSLLPSTGSWGLQSSGMERTASCH